MAIGLLRDKLPEKILNIKAQGFDNLALEVFQYQAKNNPLYAKYINLIGKNTYDIASLEQIPFLPISFFKKQTIKTGNWPSAQVFSSSGTTATTTSSHHLHNYDWYKSIAKKGFEHFYGDLSQYCFLALLPSYLERTGSSLVFMADYFIKKEFSTIWFFKSEQRPSESGFATTGFAHKPQRFTTIDVQTDAVNGTDIFSSFRKKALLYREPCFQINDLKQWF